MGLSLTCTHSCTQPLTHAGSYIYSHFFYTLMFIYSQADAHIFCLDTEVYVYTLTLQASFLSQYPLIPSLWLTSDPQGYSNVSVTIMGGHRLEGRQVPAQPLITLALLVGHYCPAETISAHPCPEGTLNPQESAVSSRACQLCPAGSYCPGEGNTWPEGRYWHTCLQR